jgi:predicted nicotinamide N-methyase
MTSIWDEILQRPTREELGTAIAAQIAVVTEPLTLGGRTYEITRVADPNCLLDDATLLSSHDQLPWHPYWAQVWDGAIGLGWELVSGQHVPRTVLDLGCGLGITGAVAASLGAEVLMADQATPALCFARWNSWPWRERVEVCHVNWRTDHLGRQFDLILGADILYDREDLPYLDRFWREHARRTASILLGDNGRPLTGALLEQLPGLGWRVRHACRTIPGLARPVRLTTLDRT